MAAMEQQTDVMIGTVRVTVSRGGLLVGLSRGDERIGMSADEARAIAALVTDELGAHAPVVPKVSAPMVTPRTHFPVTDTSKLADPVTDAAPPPPESPP
jgi:hypothetical protein